MKINHRELRELAITIDYWRVVPRLLVFTYMFFAYRIIDWFLLLPEPTTPQTVIVTAICGGIAAVFTAYASTGDKTKLPPTSPNQSD